VSVRPQLVLASASPRRREILSTLGIEFDVRPTHADESTVTAEGDEAFARAAALLKLRSALDTIEERDAYVLAADTIVCVDGRRLGKPTDDDDALHMLQRLAGREHVVMTGVAIGTPGQGPLGSEVVRTRVWFRDAPDEELRRYVATGEPADKAGAYGVQGLGSGLVTRIDGSYTNVVGLPAVETLVLLREHGALGDWP
jgi:septum formation protein